MSLNIRSYIDINFHQHTKLTNLNLYNITKKYKFSECCIKLYNRNEKYLYCDNTKTDILNPLYNQKTIKKMYIVDNKVFLINKQKIKMLINNEFDGKYIPYNIMGSYISINKYINIYKNCACCVGKFIDNINNFKKYINNIIDIPKIWNIIHKIYYEFEPSKYDKIVKNLETSDLFKKLSNDYYLYISDDINIEIVNNTIIFRIDKNQDAYKKYIGILYNHILI